MLNPVADPMRWDDRARQWWVIHALSNAHDLLMASDWKGANLEALIRHQMKAHLRDKGERLGASGPVVNLPPSLAWSFGILVHELATNALKYGAGCSPDLGSAHP